MLGASCIRDGIVVRSGEGWNTDSHEKVRHVIVPPPDAPTISGERSRDHTDGFFLGVSIPKSLKAMLMAGPIAKTKIAVPRPTDPPSRIPPIKTVASIAVRAPPVDRA
jgi:hypothetical protein